MHRWILTLLSLRRALFARSVSRRRPARMRWVSAVALIASVNGLAVPLGAGSAAFWCTPTWAQPKAPSAADIDIDVNRLWQAQPQIMAQALDMLQPRVDGRANVYAIAIAAQGSQRLFAREAQLALQVAAARFGADYRGGLLLSNDLADMTHRPLATRENIAVAARGIAGRIDPTRDLVIVYLASHGSPEAWLSTDLPSHIRMVPISAMSLAEALSQAGVRRRIVIVSACFAASWIPALANDDTIVITAAAKDRTSFGCDDSRYLTYFGEALLQGPLARGASLRDAFETARGTVTKWEKLQQFTPSLPQAFVGRNLQAIWTQRPAAGK